VQASRPCFRGPNASATWAPVMGYWSVAMLWVKSPR
jgi:hypothetical protein